MTDTLTPLERAARAVGEAYATAGQAGHLRAAVPLPYVCHAIVRAALEAIREPDEETAMTAADIAHSAVNSESGETCPVLRNHVRSYIDAILSKG